MPSSHFLLYYDTTNMAVMSFDSCLYTQHTFHQSLIDARQANCYRDCLCSNFHPGRQKTVSVNCD
ncbi:hypothetical protein RvY_19339 [Ramazzottius varieornatus]|uniref:Uncharacterized protein n=1 Tax=Ramazzottius varieornatus TaxID=947166 RepID=A0A1D1W938_RAMVA|nr:hypothetical protein RvY_19339 [Ramazzottius varieornatus]